MTDLYPLWIVAEWENALGEIRAAFESTMYVALLKEDDADTDLPSAYALGAEIEHVGSTVQSRPFGVVYPTRLRPGENLVGGDLSRHCLTTGIALGMQVLQRWDVRGWLPALGPVIQGDEPPFKRIPVLPALARWFETPFRGGHIPPLPVPHTPAGMLYLSLLMHGWWVPIFEPTAPEAPHAFAYGYSKDEESYQWGQLVGFAQTPDVKSLTHRGAPVIETMACVSWRPKTKAAFISKAVRLMSLVPIIAYHALALADPDKRRAMVDELVPLARVRKGATTDLTPDEFKTWVEGEVAQGSDAIVIDPRVEPVDDVEFVDDPGVIDAAAVMRDDEVHDMTVDLFLQLSHNVERAWKMAAQPAAEGAGWMLREARVIQFRPEVVYRVLGEVTRYIGHVVKRHGGERVEQVREMAAGVPFPEPVPFECMYFGWGMPMPAPAGVRQSLANITAEEPDQGVLWPAREDGLPAGYVQGLLMTSRQGGNAYFVVSNYNRRHIRFVTLVKNGEWVDPERLEGPWVLAWFVAAVNTHAALTIDTKHRLRRQRKLEKWAKAIGKRPLPRPYYSVTLAPGILRVRRTIVAGMPVEWQHRWDVIGHFVRRVERGELPLSERDIRELQERRYRIFTRLNPPDADAMEALIWTDEPGPGTGEWVAVQKVWRKPHIKGPKDKPYIPSVHALKKRRGIGSRR